MSGNAIWANVFYRIWSIKLIFKINRKKEEEKKARDKKTRIALCHWCRWMTLAYTQNRQSNNMQTEYTPDQIVGTLLRWGVCVKISRWYIITQNCKCSAEKIDFKWTLTHWKVIVSHIAIVSPRKFYNRWHRKWNDKLHESKRSLVYRLHNFQCIGKMVASVEFWKTVAAIFF